MTAVRNDSDANAGTSAAPRPDGEGDGRPGAPAWAHGVVAMAGYWEPLSFRRRQGAASVQDDASYAAAHAQTTARFLARIGINAVVWHGYKGLGFEYEREEMEHTRRFGEHCRTHGIHLGTYCAPRRRTA